MATVPIPQGATFQPLAQNSDVTANAPSGAVPVPQGASFQPLAQSGTQAEPTWWDKIKDVFAPRDPMSMPGATRPTGAMPGSFEGHPENVGEYVPQTVGQAAQGVANIARSSWTGRRDRGIRKRLWGCQRRRAGFPLAQSAGRCCSQAARGHSSGELHSDRAKSLRRSKRHPAQRGASHRT